jgi:hypothetical protein
MIPPIDAAALSVPAQKLVGPQAPLKMQELAAKGVAPGIKPAEMLAILLVFRSSDRPTVKQAAEQTLEALPPHLLAAAVGADLPAAVIDALARPNAGKIEVLEKLLSMPQIAMETVEEIARQGDEAVTELVATNEERLLGHPRIIELLYMNKRTRMSTADRLVELAARNKIELTGIPAWKEAVAAIQDELIPEASAEPTPSDLLFAEAQELAHQLATAEDEDTHVEDEEGKERLRKKFLPLYARIAEMTVSERIRAGLLGTKEERMLLVRDNNRMVATAAVRSPLMKESEAALITRNRNISDEVLRIIGSTPELVKSYTVKKNLVENPRTPVMIATRLIAHMREADLKQLAKSKNITGPVQDAARRHLDRRKS